MHVKQCPECGAKSYSASDRGDWECPECGADLAGLGSEVADGAGEDE